MKIKKVQLLGSGFKGAVVTYLREEEKNGRAVVNEIIEKRKHPIHLSMETMFKDLRYHLLDITGVLRGDEEKMEKDFTIEGCEVVGVEFSDEMFVISGERDVFADKKIKLKTCKVDSLDNYEHYESVMALINSIVEESKEYLAGTKKVDDVEVATRFVQAGKSKDMTVDGLRAMSAEQLKEFATKLLENSFGSVVMHGGDMEIDEDELKESVEKQLGEIDGGEEIVIPAIDLSGNAEVVIKPAF